MIRAASYLISPSKCCFLSHFLKKKTIWLCPRSALNLHCPQCLQESVQVSQVLTLEEEQSVILWHWRLNTLLSPLCTQCPLHVLLPKWLQWPCPRCSFNLDWPSPSLLFSLPGFPICLGSSYGMFLMVLCPCLFIVHDPLIPLTTYLIIWGGGWHARLPYDIVSSLWSEPRLGTAQSRWSLPFAKLNPIGCVDR